MRNERPVLVAQPRRGDSCRIRALPMDVSHILDPLNDAQRQAVTAPLAPTLVLAGAGSGKTRVLTHRVEWLVQVEGVSPHGILAVTFTNKAAGEMRHRIETQLGLPSAPLWIGTFHGICHRLLRTALARCRPAAGLPDPRWRGPAAAREEDRARPRPRRNPLGPERGHVVHQRAEGRGPAPEAPEGRRRPDAAPDDPALRGVRGNLPAQRRRGFRRVAAAELRDPGATCRGSPTTTARASATCWSTSSRTPTPSSTAG